ncbi:MAG: hypothetical protein J6T60_04670 [Bacteroidales bacterium]|nr:hypothetical protein [Bacteroidales bacterium]
METTNTETAHEYTEEERRTLITNFFEVPKKPDLQPYILDLRMVLVIFGVVVGFVLLGYLKRAIPTIILCTTCFGFALWQAILVLRPYLEKNFKYSNRATEDQMKAWLIKDLKETVKPKSINTLSLNMADIRPENFIIIPIPIYWQASGIEPGHVKRCPLDDDTYVYSMWRVQILVLTKHYISLFKCNYDWFSNSISSISTNEFYFQDITSIRNDMREIDYNFIDDPETPIGAGKVFCVTNFSGEYLTVVNDIPSLNMTNTVAVDLEYIVSLLRMVIRNRRFGITHEEMSSHEQQSIDGTANDEEHNENTAEAINSIEYLLNKRDDEMNQQESQFGGTPFSSFDEQSDDNNIGEAQQT